MWIFRTYCWGQRFGDLVNGNYVSGYDIWGNLLKITASKAGCGVPTLTATGTTKNQLVLTGVTHDAAGNMTNAGGGVLTYDAENRLINAAGVNYVGACPERSRRNGDGRRVKKDTSKLYWYGPDGEVNSESDVAGTWTIEHMYFNGKRVARRELVPGYSLRYHFSDHLGSASVVTNVTETVKDESDYYPFGGERVITNQDPNQYKFTGKERDTESGLDYFGARYHSSSLGRFTSVDPSGLSANRIQPQSWNRYTYSLNNPLAYTDQNGKWSTRVHNEIIDRVFGSILDASSAALLKIASRDVDSDQSQEGSYKHGLRQPGQSVELASGLSNAFVNENLSKAVQSQIAWEKQYGGTADQIGYGVDALKYFGTALHTVTDSQSPWHTGFQVWRGSSNPIAWARHGVQEAMSGKNDQVSIALAEHEARLDGWPRSGCWPGAPHLPQLADVGLSETRHRSNAACGQGGPFRLANS